MVCRAAPNASLLLAIAAVVLAITGLASAFTPARRAASVDPMETLRSE